MRLFSSKSIQSVVSSDGQKKTKINIIKGDNTGMKHVSVTTENMGKTFNIRERVVRKTPIGPVIQNKAFKLKASDIYQLFDGSKKSLKAPVASAKKVVKKSSDKKTSTGDKKTGDKKTGDKKKGDKKSGNKKTGDKKSRDKKTGDKKSIDKKKEKKSAEKKSIKKSIKKYIEK
jgi:hypothetical protein